MSLDLEEDRFVQTSRFVVTKIEISGGVCESEDWIEG